jgi:hypothetical protein
MGSAMTKNSTTGLALAAALGALTVTAAQAVPRSGHRGGDVAGRAALHGRGLERPHGLNRGHLGHGGNRRGYVGWVYDDDAPPAANVDVYITGTVAPPTPIIIVPDARARLTSSPPDQEMKERRRACDIRPYRFDGAEIKVHSC